MVVHILLPLAGGLAVFLFGMKVMELALHRWAKDTLKNILVRYTKTPLRGLATGTIATALLQSSSAVSVITIGLVNAEILTFPQTLGIVLGMNIGPTVTTELISLNIQSLAVPLLIGSFLLWMFSWLFSGRNIPIVRSVSLAVSGFACVLLGITIMQSILPALKSEGMFAWFVEQSQRSLLWALIAGVCVTAVIQSSTAAIAMTMGLASMGAIGADVGIAIVLGANAGTCLTALIASVGGSRAGQWVAWSHVILNVGGAVLFFPLIPLLEQFASWLSPHLSGQIAHTQTFYNIACSLIALPLCYLPVIRSFSPVKS